MRQSVLVLGGYGNFGTRIVSALASDSDACVYVAGRDAQKATTLADAIGRNAEPLVVDHLSGYFYEQLQKIKPTVVVHTAGPFQDQDYKVARACVATGCHYVDIADGRNYVAGIGKLDADARRSKVLIVTGASSLPALSSAVIDRYAQQFARLDKIEHTISSGAKPPGVATMQGVMGYVGKGFKRWQGGAWKEVFGWQGAARMQFPVAVGNRWVVNCDVPDLELFPARYPTAQSVIFKAGIGFASTTLAVWVLSWLVRYGVISNLAKYAERLHQVALAIEPLGTQWSAMRVQLNGVDSTSAPLQRVWLLLAGDNHGPNIPCFPAIALTRKLLRDEMLARGAMPCMGLLTVEDILSAMPALNLHVVEYY